MSEGGAFAQGSAQFPLTSDVTNTLLRDADPALYYTIEYFKSVLTTYLNDRFVQEITRASVTTMSSIVQTTTHFDPALYLPQFLQSFPLLAVFRQSSKYSRKTHSWMHIDSQWAVYLILAPLKQWVQPQALHPIFHAAESVLVDRIENMFDPSFTGGAEVWKLAGVEEISLTDSKFGMYTGFKDSQLSFPSWMGTLSVKERQMPVLSQYQALTGLDTQIDADSPNDPPVENFIDEEIDFTTPATIANVAGFYQGDAGLTYPADGYHVAGWADQSAAAANLAGATNAQPIERLQAFLVPDQAKLVAKSAVRFDGLVSSLTATSAALNVDTGVTLVVFARLYNTANRQSLLLRTVAADATGAHTLGPEANTASSAGGLFGVFAGGSSYDSETATDQQWHVHIVRVTGTANTTAIAGTLSYRIDGAEQTLTKKSGTGNWQGMATSSLLALGGNPAAFAATALVGDVAIAGAFARRLTDAECSALETYCRLWAGTPPT